MADRMRDDFDARLAALLVEYGDAAVGAHSSSAIAHAAVTARAPLGARVSPRTLRLARFALLAAALILIALAAAILAGSRHATSIGDPFTAPSQLVWSPDGSTLAFAVEVADAATGGGSSATSSGRPWHGELWAVAGGGGEPRRLAVLPSMRVPNGLVWTPDGRSLLFAVGAPPGQAPTGPGEVIEVGLDGSTTRTLSETGDYLYPAPVLSPGGDRFAYASSDGLYVADLATGASTRIADPAGVDSWSPDGRWILYDMGNAAGSVGPGSSTIVAAADGSARHELGTCCGLGWSADSSRVYLQADNGDLTSVAVDGGDPRTEVHSTSTSTIWRQVAPGEPLFVASDTEGIVIARTGETPRRVPGSEPGDNPTAVSPDGRWVSFSGRRNGVNGDYVLPTGGGTAMRAGPGPYPTDAWRPGAESELALVDGRAIVGIRPDGTGRRDIVPRATVAGDPLGGADQAAAAVIVIGPEGPEHDTYRVPAGGPLVGITVENRSSVPWTPIVAEKGQGCLSDAGPVGPDPCTVEPGETVSYAYGDGFAAGSLVVVPFVPEGGTSMTGFPVLVSFEAAP